MIAWWNKFRRWLGFPVLDLPLYVAARDLVELDFDTMSLIVRRDIEYWLNRKIGANNWKCDLGDFDPSHIDWETHKGQPFVITLWFRYVEDPEYFNKSWLTND